MGSLMSRIRQLFNDNKETRMIMIGLDNAGKTSMLYKLKIGEIVSTIPTIGFNVSEIKYINMSMQVWDIGGQTKIRKLWDHYYNNLDGIIFIVDSVDRTRLEEVRYELEKLTKVIALQGVPVLIYANKQDAPRAMRAGAIGDRLNMGRLFVNRNWYIQPCSVLRGEGLYDGLEWIRNEILMQ